MDIVKKASLKALETRFAAHVLHLHNTEAVSYLDSEGFCVRQASNGSAVRLDTSTCAPAVKRTEQVFA